jgi:hypothetical protein
MTRFTGLKLAVILAVVGFMAGIALAGEKAAPAEAGKKVNVLLVTGGHGFDEKPFLAVFEGMTDITFKHVVQKSPSDLFEDIADWPYDAIVLYNYNQKMSDKQRENLLKLLDKGVGLFVMHHAIAAYPDWPEFIEIFGAKYYLAPTPDHPRSIFKHDVDLKVHVEDAEHPITKGLTDYTIHDETYGKYTVSPGVHVLLTTDEPTSEKIIGWVKLYKKARVAFIESGHDSKAYANPNFITLTDRAIQWVAGRLPEGNLTPAKAEK